MPEDVEGTPLKTTRRARWRASLRAAFYISPKLKRSLAEANFWGTIAYVIGEGWEEERFWRAYVILLMWARLRIKPYLLDVLDDPLSHLWGWLFLWGATYIALDLVFDIVIWIRMLWP